MTRGSSLHPISLAAGVVPDASPLQCVQAADAAGFDAVGLWLDLETWTPQTTRAVKAALHAAGLPLLDVEVLWIRPGPLDPAHLRALDIGLELGAANALVVSADPDQGATAEKFAALCAHVAGSPLHIALEFGAFTEIAHLEQALDILRGAASRRSIRQDSADRRDVAPENAALLVDALHLQRSGGRARSLASLPPALLRYAQLCDAPESGPDMHDTTAIRAEAIDGRCCPGDGALPLYALLAVLPHAIPLSIEVRSKALREAHPEPMARARAVAAATRRWLAAAPARLLRGAA